jgi:hypothetical protein
LSVSTDALLFYGYCWDDEGVEILPGGEDDWRTVILRRRGEKNPWDDYPAKAVEAIRDYQARQAAEEAWVAGRRSLIDAFYAKKRVLEEEYGCDVGTHCSGDYPMPYAFVTSSKVMASRGYPVEVKSLAVGPDWDARLNRFLEDLGVDKPQPGPRWWLASYWG